MCWRKPAPPTIRPPFARYSETIRSCPSAVLDVPETFSSATEASSVTRKSLCLMISNVNGSTVLCICPSSFPLPGDDAILVAIARRRLAGIDHHRRDRSPDDGGPVDLVAGQQPHEIVAAGVLDSSDRVEVGLAGLHIGRLR